MSSPGTGIEAITWEAYAGSGAGLDWHIVDTVRASTLTNLDNFIAAVAATTDLTFVVGGLAFDAGTQVFYRFTSTAGAKIPLGGLIPVVPATVAGTNVTLGTNGKVSMAASPSASLNTCFTSAFDNYRIEIDIPTTSTALAVTFVFRLAGVDVTTANYDSQTIQAQSVTATVVQALAATSWSLAAATREIHRITVELTRPATATPTLGFIHSLSTPNPMTSTAATVDRGLLHRLTTAYDGFTITASTGTMTGSIRVYGYNSMG